MTKMPATSSAQRDRVDPPHWGWWTSILFGMSLLTLLVCSDGAYAFFCAHVTTLLTRPLLLAILVTAVALHVGEALYAYALAGRLGLENARGGWTLQTLILGYPSLRLLLRRAR